MGNPLIPQAQPMAQAAPVQAPPDPAIIQEAHKHLGIVTSGLTDLIAQKPGTLTKQDVFAKAADMIKAGAFPEPQGRQQLIQQLAGLPDDEGAIRQFLGQHLMSFSAAQSNAASMLQGGQNGGGQ